MDTITTRYALVPTDGLSAETLERYLPGNYRIISTSPRGHLVAGKDDSGWTLDAYVIPRLASGLYFAREVRGHQFEVSHSEVAVHCRVNGLTCHVIEEDRFLNGNEIPEDARCGCWVIDNSPRGGGVWVPMLKDEAGWPR